MKLNKRRVKMLVGIIVGVLLLVGTCIGNIINSVDYEKAEEDMCNVEKMNLKEICKLLGVNPANSARLEKDLLKFNITLQDHKYYLFSMVMVKTLDGMRDFFVVNPSVIWKGTNVDDVIDIIDCMFFK